MRVLVACEYSGTVRDAFLAAGHEAVSCDLLPSERPGPHIQGDVLGHLGDGWDLMVGFPPCTHLALSGARWFVRKPQEQEEAIAFFRRLWEVAIPRVALENPVGIMSGIIGPPHQVVQPYEFGDPHRKTTCLYLRNLPPLSPTRKVDVEPDHVTRSGRRLPRWYNIPPRADRGLIRSRTFPGLALAMAAQWGTSGEYRARPVGALG